MYYGNLLSHVCFNGILYKMAISHANTHMYLNVTYVNTNLYLNIYMENYHIKDPNCWITIFIVKMPVSCLP